MNEITTFLNTNPDVLLALGVIFMLIVFVVIYGLTQAIKATEYGRATNEAMKLLYGFALDVIISANEVPVETLATYKDMVQVYGIDDLDPRMAYVLVQLEEYVEDKTAIDLDILQIYHIAQSVFVQNKDSLQ